MLRARVVSVSAVALSARAVRTATPNKGVNVSRRRDDIQGDDIAEQCDNRAWDSTAISHVALRYSEPAASARWTSRRTFSVSSRVRSRPWNGSNISEIGFVGQRTDHH